MKNKIILMIAIFFMVIPVTTAFKTFITPESKVVNVGQTFPVKIFITPTDEEELPIYDIKSLNIVVDSSKEGIIEFVRFEPAINLSNKFEPTFYQNDAILNLEYTGSPIVNKTPIEIWTLYIKEKGVWDFKLYVYRSYVDTGHRYDEHYKYGDDDVDTQKSTFVIKLQTLNTIQPVWITGIKQVTSYSSTPSTDTIVNTDTEVGISNNKLEIIKDQDNIVETTNQLEQVPTTTSTEENTTTNGEEVEIQQEQNQNNEIESQDSMIDSWDEEASTIEEKDQNVEEEKQINETRESKDNNQILIFIWLGIFIMLILLFIKRWK